jgi:hypothetical protein
MAVVVGLGLELGLAMPPVPGLGSAAAAPQGSADLEWAQQVLKEKGFDPGRANGEMTSRTRAALSAYQHSVGLPATGELDGATIARLMAGHASSSTMGNLAAPQHVHEPAGREAAPAPHAAPSGRVEAGGGTGDVPVFGSGGGSSGGGSGGGGAVAGGGMVPRAASGGTVTAAPSLVPAPLAGEAPSEAAGTGPFALTVPEWVRDAVLGVMVAIVGGFGVLWWWSGRRPAGRREPLSVEADGPVRIEPRFDSADRGRGGGSPRSLRAERFR